jgi:hypothetical protein
MSPPRSSGLGGDATSSPRPPPVGYAPDRAPEQAGGSAPAPTGGAAVPVRALFLVLLLLLFVPSRMIALAHGAGAARVLGASVSILAVWFLLYRLCLRARRRAWFTACAIAAVYVATFGAPYLAWCALLVLFVVHRYTKRLDSVSRGGAQPDFGEAGGVQVVMADVDAWGAPQATPPGEPNATANTASRIEVVTLDPICRPYGRILFSGRILRAATATLVGTAVVVGPPWCSGLSSTTMRRSPVPWVAWRSRLSLS